MIKAIINNIDRTDWVETNSVQVDQVLTSQVDSCNFNILSYKANSLVLDDFEYLSDASIQSSWIEANDGDNPVIETDDKYLGTTCGKFSYTNSTNLANFTRTLGTAIDLSDYSGMSSGDAVSGNLSVWIRLEDYSETIDVSFYLYDSSGNYRRYLYSHADNNDWQNIYISLADHYSSSGVIDWTDINKIVLRVSETDDKYLLVDDLRINKTNISGIKQYSPVVGYDTVIYFGFPMADDVGAGSSREIPISYNVNDEFDLFEFYRIGDEIIVCAGGEAQETAVITNVVKSSKYSTDGYIVVDKLENDHLVGEFVGKYFFGGNINNIKADISDENTKDVVYRCECVDYTKQMDRKTVNNVYQDVDLEYIINDIINRNINYNEELEDFEYANATALRAIWSDTDDGDPANRETSDYKEGEMCSEFPWTNSGGKATFTAVIPTTVDVSDIVGTSSGVPEKGWLQFWYKVSDYTLITEFLIQVGSSSGNYHAYNLDIPTDNNWHLVHFDLTQIQTTTGTVDWTAIEHVSVSITETNDGNILLDGLRITDDGYFTLEIDSGSPTYEDVRFSFKAVSLVIEKIVSLIGWQWYVSYDKVIKVFSTNSTSAPFQLTETDAKYNGLSIQPDLSQLVNRLTVQGGTEPSSNQVNIYESNGVDTIFFVKEAPRTNGYDDELLRATYDFAVSVNTGSGYVAATYGISNVEQEGTYDFLLNPEEKYLEADQYTPSSGDLIKIEYTFNKPILVRVDDASSIAEIKSLLGGDGIIEHSIIDKKIKSSNKAYEYGYQYLAKYSNAIVNLSFETEYHGLEAGQLINLTNDEFRYLSEPFLIQRVNYQVENRNDMVLSKVIASTTLFGIIELFKLLLDEELEIDATQAVNLIESNIDSFSLSDTGSTASLGVTTFYWSNDAGTTSDKAVWGLSQWS